MSIWESVGSTYVEAATSALPLHRIILFGCGLLGATAIKSQTHCSILETLSKSKVMAFASVDTGPLAVATIGDILVGIGMVVIGWISVRLLLLATFSIAARTTDLWNRSKTTLRTMQAPQSMQDRKAAIEVLEESLKEPRARLRTFNALSELLCGTGVGLIIAAWWGNALDFAVGLALFAITIGLVVASVRLFVSEYFGPAMVKARLEGRPYPTPWGAG